RMCSTASLVAAGPAKYAAGSPGNARVKRKVTITTPIRLGIANIKRLPIMFSIVSRSRFVFVISQHDAVCSLPPCGGGLGRGVSREGGACGYPPLCPCPARGEGTRERGSSLGRESEQCKRTRRGYPSPRLRLHQRAVIEAAVEPVL